jgi:hypothetical protein
MGVKPDLRDSATQSKKVESKKSKETALKVLKSKHFILSSKNF